MQHDLQILLDVKRSGLEPLRAYLRGSNGNHDRSEWVRRLCAIDMPELAERFAKEPATRQAAAFAPTPLVFSVGRYYLDHGNRAEGVRVFTEGATAAMLVRSDNAGKVLPGPLLALALREPGDIDAALAISKGVKDPFLQYASLLAIAQRCVEGGDRKKAKEILDEAEKVVEMAASSLPPESRNSALLTPCLRLWKAYRDFDGKTSDKYADCALEAASKVRDAQAKVNADDTAVEKSKGVVRSIGPGIGEDPPQGTCL